MIFASEQPPSGLPAIYPRNGGRSAFAVVSANIRGRKNGGKDAASNLPPCGGDARQGRAGQRRAPALRNEAFGSQVLPC
ncbi:hypothetical protein Amn_52970 [Aminobacter sp. Y103A]|nr:hypothetical protein Amn_52970 [Aminobacter sp. SS-2016]